MVILTGKSNRFSFIIYFLITTTLFALLVIQPKILRISFENPWDDSHHIKESPEKESIPKRYVLTETSNDRNSAMAPYPTIQDSKAANPASPMSAPPPRKQKKMKAKEWILEFSAGTLTGIVSGLIFSWLFKLVMFLTRKRVRGDTNLKIFSPMIKKPQDLSFLKREDGLESLDVIGRGGCGEVYRALLPGNNGKQIAIKKIAQPQPSRDTEHVRAEDIKLVNMQMRQIRAEIQTVGNIRHRNLLPLLAHVPRHDCHYLVYEYMKNGSLQDWLQNAVGGGKDFDWLTRYNIALGVAAGIEYLHENHTTRIIHRDLKPANILLDDNMEARIADFGLAKMVPDANTHFSTSNIAGTMGYIAPEYYQTFTFTEKCDVYSFGVVLGTLVIGKLPSDDFFQHTDEMSLVEWMRAVMTSEEPKQAIDTMLLGNGYEEQMLLVLKVACFCTLEDPKKRPTSKDARCMLSQIKH